MITKHTEKANFSFINLTSLVTNRFSGWQMVWQYNNSPNVNYLQLNSQADFKTNAYWEQQMVCGNRVYAEPHKACIIQYHSHWMRVFLGGGIVMTIQILIISSGRHKSYGDSHDTQNGKKGPWSFKIDNKKAEWWKWMYPIRNIFVNVIDSG